MSEEQKHTSNDNIEGLELSHCDDIDDGLSLSAATVIDSQSKSISSLSPPYSPSSPSSSSIISHCSSQLSPNHLIYSPSKSISSLSSTTNHCSDSPIFSPSSPTPPSSSSSSPFSLCRTPSCLSASGGTQDYQNGYNKASEGGSSQLLSPISSNSLTNSPSFILICSSPSSGFSYIDSSSSFSDFPLTYSPISSDSEFQTLPIKHD